MRLIDADKVPPLSDLSGCAYEGGEYQAYKSGAEYGRGLVDDTPTIDPESLRPTAHIMRGTVQSTHDAGFCSNCKLCIDENYGTALAKSYSYCPPAPQSLGVDHADKRLSALWKMQILESPLHQQGKQDVRI